MIPFALTASVATVAGQAQPAAGGDWIVNVLRGSMEAKKGVTVYVKGQSIGMLVTAVGDHYVEGRSQQASKIVVRLAAIDAAVMA